MYDTVLIPTDGSEHSVRAAEHGLSIARAFGATAHVVTVIDVQDAAGVFLSGHLDEQFQTHLEDLALEALETVEAVVTEDDVVDTEIVRGEPSEAILEYASEHDIDLVAMGTHGRTGLDRYITGSVTERVVRLAEVPVLTVRETERSRLTGGYEEILVPTDGSEPAAVAVEPALALAAQLGARVHAVSIVDVGDLALSPDYTAPTELTDHLEAEATAVTDRIATQAREHGLDAVTAVYEGRPASGLLEYASEHDIDLIAMGTQGRTGLGRYLLGSTTERVIRHADVPVLAVNARRVDSD